MFIRIVTLLSVLMLSVSAFAADNIWKIFEVKGKASIITEGGSRALSNEKSLLETVRKGNKIKTEAGGKVVVVSLKNRQAYELGDNSEAIVEEEQVRAIKGTVVIKKGFSLPKSSDGRMGGIVMRGAGNTRSCLKALSPLNTAVLDLTPLLRWENNCDGLTQVTITVLADERTVLTSETTETSFKIPAEVLKPGSRYMWMIDGGANFDMASGVFSIPTEAERNEALGKISEFNRESSEDVAAMIAYIYYLDGKGLNELTRLESDKLRKRFPDSEGLKELP
ncbi:MAG: hypothetical protein JJE30_13505 [Desulfuromonadales bacterium]|nr:hypothetical protein [Desulfuromonadales bacterium]